MRKKDISKTLSKGSPKQRLMIVAEDIARRRFSSMLTDRSVKEEDSLLTDSEFNQLSDSFKTDKEISLWNRWNKIDKKLVGAIQNLQSLSLEVEKVKAQILGYTLVWSTLENSEFMVNQVLNEITDKKERKRIAKKSVKDTDFIFTEPQIDKEGYVDLTVDPIYKGDKITNALALRKLIDNLQKTVTEVITQYISWDKAINDYLEEEGFKVKSYLKILDQLRERVLTINVFGKYDSSQDRFVEEVEKVRADKIKPYYNSIPDISKFKVDQNHYSFFKEEYLTYE